MFLLRCHIRGLCADVHAVLAALQDVEVNKQDEEKKPAQGGEMTDTDIEKLIVVTKSKSKSRGGRDDKMDAGYANLINDGLAMYEQELVGVGCSANSDRVIGSGPLCLDHPSRRGSLRGMAAWCLGYKTVLGADFSIFHL